MTRVVTMKSLAPTVKGFFSGETHHPEYVGTTCDDCDTHGYVHESDADARMNGDARIVCAECSA